MAGIPYVSDPLQMLWKFQQDQANTDLLRNQSLLTGANAQEQQIKNVLMGQQMQSNAAQQKGWRDVEDMDQQATQQAPTPNQPMMGAPQMGGPGGDDSSGPAPQPVARAPLRSVQDMTPIERAEMRLASMEKTANQYDWLANRPNILASDIQALKKSAFDARAKIQEESIKLMDEKSKQLTRIGGFAGAAAEARTPDALMQALRGIANEDPRKLQELPVEIASDGSVVPTDRIFNALQTLAQSSMKQSEQLTAAQQAKTLQQTAIRDAETRRANQAREVNNDVRAAIYRDAVNAQVKNAKTNADREARAAGAVGAVGPDGQPLVVGALQESTARMVAEMALESGKIPPLGYGKNAALQRQQVLDAMDQIRKERGMSGGDITTNQASYKANSASLTQATKSLDAVTSFSNTAIKNGDVLVKMAQEVDATGIPLIERWIRAGRQATGDPKVAAFNAQMRVYIPEVAKILSNPNLTGQLTDTARKEIESVVSGGASAEQIMAIHNTLKADFANRETALKDQIADIKDRMVQKKGGGTSSGPVKIKDATEYNALPKGTVFIDPDGVQRTKQ